MLLLTKGEVRLYIQDDGVESIDLYTLKEGEQCIVNTASSISNTDAIASAESITDIEGYLLDSKSIQNSLYSPLFIKVTSFHSTPFAWLTLLNSLMI